MSANHDSSPYSEAQEEYVATAHLPYIASPLHASIDPSPEHTPIPSQPISATKEMSDIDQLATTYRLGLVQKELKNEVGKGLSSGLASLFVGILCFLPIILAALNYGGRYTLGLRWTFLMGIAFLSYGINRTTIGINNFIANISRLNGHYYLCRNGLLRIKGRRAEGLRWDQVNAIQKILAADGNRIHQYILYAAEDQEPFVLEKVGNTFKALGLQIEEGVAKYLLPSNIASYKAGQTLDFGVFTITPQGLSFKEEERQLTWEEVGSIEAQKETLTIKHKHTLEIWAEIDTSSLLNLCILLPLVKEIQSNPIQEKQPKSLSYQPIQNRNLQSSEWQEYE